jgi:hypothetical protein
MISLLRMLSPTYWGIRSIDVAEAFGTPPMTPAAWRYRAAALSLFMAAAVLLLTAALVDTIANARPASEVFGWLGIGCLQMCVYCGLRYKAANESAPKHSVDQI